MIDVGSRLRDYEIVARLKAGGMATLFLARRSGAAGFARHVAIKVVHPHLASDPEFVRMFVEEAKLSARIQHPNVVHVEELGHVEGKGGGTYFLVMEYVHGSALSTLLAALSRLERRFSPEMAVWLAMRIADGLHAAHETTDEEGRPLGVVHRDVSPQNVLVSSAGHLKLIDFGIAKAATNSKRTETGALKGKLRYMSPEQARGIAIDRRTDVYALGIVLWEMLTMHRLFRSTNDLALIDEVRDPEIDPPRELAPDLPEALDAVVMRALSKDPAQRPATAFELKRLLSEALPAANAVDPAQLAEVMGAVLGERMEARRRDLPESLNLTGMTRPAGPSHERSLHAQGVLKSMTVSAPGVRYQPDGEVSLDGVQEIDVRVGMPAVPGGSTPMSSSVSSPGAPPSRDRVFALVAGGIALIALGVAAGALLGQRDPDPAPVAAPLAPVVPVAATQPPPALEPDAGLELADDDESAAVEADEDEATPTRRGARRRGRRDREAADPGVRRAVDGVPIYEDEW